MVVTRGGSSSPSSKHNEASKPTYVGVIEGGKVSKSSVV